MEYICANLGVIHYGLYYIYWKKGYLIKGVLAGHLEN